MATKYFVSGGTNLWNNTNSWSLLSGGIGGAGIPSSSDDLILDVNSPNCILSTTAGLGKSINFTGYINTITFNVGLTVIGNLTFGVNMNFAGTGTITISATTATITSNGVLVQNPITIQGGGNTITLADNLNMNALFTSSGVSGSTQTINGNQINLRKNLTCSGNQNYITMGTTVFYFLGSGTGNSLWTHNNITKNNIVIDCGTNSFSYSGASTGFNGYSDGTIKYISGIAGTFLNSLNFSSGTIDWSGNTTYLPFSILWQVGAIVTLLSDIYIGSSGYQIVTISGTYDIYINGSCTGSINGNNIYLTGTGTWTGVMNCNIIINTLGTITITSSITLSSNKSINYISGTVITTGTTLIITTCTLNTNGILWENININNISTSIPTVTITLNSTLNVNSNINISSLTFIFAGNHGFICNSLTFPFGQSQSQGLLTLVSGINYVIKNSFTCVVNTLLNPFVINSSTSGTSAYLTLQQGAAQNLSFIKATDINSSQGQTIWCWQPVLSNTNNWISLLPSNIQFADTFIK